MVRALKLFGCLSIAVLCLTGCSSEETLTCSMEDESSGVSMEQIVEMTFKDDKINKVKMTVNTKATDDTMKENWNLIASSMDEQFDEKSSDGVSLSKDNDTDNHTYKVELSVDLDKATEDSLSEYGLDGITDDDSTLEETKKEAEDSGFTCK